MAAMTAYYDQVIIGGGMVADAAARGIREIDPDSSIVVLSADVEPPYARPALTKKLWTDDDFSWQDAELRTAEDTGAEVRTGVFVDRIDTEAHEVVLAGGERVRYGRALLATGGIPSDLGLPESERIVAFRSAGDYRTVRSWADDGAHVAVVGGGYLGSEIAASLVQNGARVTLVVPEQSPLGELLPASLAGTVQAWFEAAGVQLRRGVRVDSGTAHDTGVELVLDDGSTLAADAAVIAVGIRPETLVAERSGLELGDGVRVDSSLQTSAADVYAAGDTAEYPDPILGRRRVEHVDNAQEMGRIAGRVLAGAEEHYDHTPYYYSVLFGTRFEAVGSLDSSLATVEDLRDGRGVVYYLDGPLPVGVLLWDVEGARDAARATIASGSVADPEELRGRIPF